LGLGAADRRVDGRPIEREVGWMMPKDETVVVIARRVRSTAVQAPRLLLLALMATMVTIWVILRRFSFARVGSDTPPASCLYC